MSPTKPARPCRVATCSHLQPCPVPGHQKQPWEKRPSPQTYNSAEWKRLRARVLREEPTCRLRLPGCTGRSTTAAHIQSVAERPNLFLVRSNVRGSCASCNHREASAKGGRR